MRYLLGLALLVSAAAQSAPVPNLVLTCSDENAVGQNQDACEGIWAYQIPTDPLIVSAGPYGIWRVFGDLIGADTVFVCTLPVEPGQYSSCRDANGVRRMALVRKDSIVAGGSVTVDQTGADYTDPVTAAQNAFAGDTWCVASQWPAQPCVMAIGEGVFILHETLNIPEGLVVAGAGKGATMLVADNGVDLAVYSFGNVRISDLAIVNSQVGLAAATGLFANGEESRGANVQLHDLAIHVSGAVQNVAIAKRVNLDILDSDITAVGEDATGIAHTGYNENAAFVTLERSHIAAEVAFEEGDSPGRARFSVLDSHISGRVFIDKPNSQFEAVGSTMVGAVSVGLYGSWCFITSSSVTGNVSCPRLTITDTDVEGGVSAYSSLPRYLLVRFDGLRVHGEVTLRGSSGGGTIARSYISSSGTAAALSLGDTNVQLEQTFVQGAQAVAVGERSGLQSSSSVLAGPISASATAVLSCTDTYGADYELLNATCLPQAP